jgi:hypothetical protein
MSSYYNCYTLKTNTTANDWSDLVNLTYQINMTTNTQFRDSVEAVMNTNSFINAWAAYNLFVEFDSYPYRFIHNYYIYHDSLANKFQWIVWDASTAFGMDVPMTISQIEALSVLYVTPQATDRPLVNRMLNNTIYKDAYLKAICSFADNDFLPSVLNPKIDTLYNRIKNWVYADPLKMYTNQNFDNNINTNITVSSINYPGVKSFISNRSASVLSELNTLGYTNCAAIWTGVNEADPSDEIGLNIYPNPFSESATLQMTNSLRTNSELKIYDVFGREVSQNLIPNKAGSFTIKRGDLQSGIYFVKVLSKNYSTVNKIVIQ